MRHITRNSIPFHPTNTIALALPAICTSRKAQHMFCNIHANYSYTLKMK